MVINNKRFIYMATLDRVSDKLEKLVAIKNDEEIKLCFSKLNEIKDLVGEVGIFDYEDDTTIQFLMEQTKELIKIENVIDKFIAYYDACEKRKYVYDKVILECDESELDEYIRIIILALDSIKRVSSNKIDLVKNSLDDMYKLIYLLMKIEFNKYGKSILFTKFENSYEDRLMINKLIMDELCECINGYGYDEEAIEIAKRIKFIEEREDFYDEKIIAFLSLTFDFDVYDKVIDEYNKIIEEISKYSLEIKGRQEDCIDGISEEIQDYKKNISKLRMDIFKSLLSIVISFTLAVTSVFGLSSVFKKMNTIKKYNSTKVSYNTVDKEYETVSSEYTEYNIGDVMVTEMRPEDDGIRESRTYLIPKEEYESEFGSFESIYEKIYMLRDYKLIDSQEFDETAEFKSSEYYLLIEEIKTINFEDMVCENDINSYDLFMDIIVTAISGILMLALGNFICEKIKLMPNDSLFEIDRMLGEAEKELKELKGFLNMHYKSLEEDKKRLLMAQEKLTKLCDIYQYVMDLALKQGKIKKLDR